MEDRNLYYKNLAAMAVAQDNLDRRTPPEHPCDTLECIPMYEDFKKLSIACIRCGRHFTFNDFTEDELDTLEVMPEFDLY